MTSISDGIKNFAHLIRTSFPNKRERLEYIQKRLESSIQQYEWSKNPDDREVYLADIVHLNRLFKEMLVDRAFEVLGANEWDEAKKCFVQICRNIYVNETDSGTANKKMELPKNAYNILNILASPGT